MVTISVLYTLLVGICAVPVVVFVAYLLVLLLAASLPERNPKVLTAGASDQAIAEARLRTVVIVPAHNEEQLLSGTLRSLFAQDYPEQLCEIVVVADNCTDLTAEIARDFGATVLERCDTKELGKGYALDWAISQLLTRPDPADAFVIVDADTWVAPDFLRRMSQRLAAGRDARGCCALQGRYGVLNGGDGWRAALMAAAFDLYNHVRPLGYSRLGLTVSLKGNGMAFTRQVLQLAQWKGHSITEDVDFGLDLIRNHSITVGYVPDATVLAQMPVTSAQAASQRKRWEGGRYRLLRNRALPLIVDGVRRRRVSLCDAGFSLVMPPLAELTSMLVLWGCLIALGWQAHLLPNVHAWMVSYVSVSAGLAVYVLGGLRAAGAPRAAYIALLKAPFYVVWKFALYSMRLVKLPSQQSEPKWVRTERLPVLVDTPPELSAQASKSTESVQRVA